MATIQWERQRETLFLVPKTFRKLPVANPGERTPFLRPLGVAAPKIDNSKAEAELVDTGDLAMETYVPEICIKMLGPRNSRYPLI